MMQHINVLHSIDCWLPQTMVWMYEQLLHLAPPFIPHVLCQERQHTDQFEIGNLHLVSGHSLFLRLKKRLAYRLNMIPFEPSAERMAKSIGISLLHSHFGNMAWMNLRTAERLRLPHVVSFYGFDVRALVTRDHAWQKRYQQLFSKVNRVLALGPNMAAELASMGCDRRKISVHHLGVDLTSLPFRPRRWYAGKPLRVLMVGTFKEKKGIPYALSALAKVKGHTSLNITIIGDASSDPQDQIEKQRILDTVHRLNLGQIVTFLGYQPYDRLLREAYQHHLFLAPSVTAEDGDTEGIPMTIVEMAASGMPVISTVHADIPEIIDHGKTGWLVPERSVDALADCLHVLISHPDKWEPIISAGRKRMEQGFDAHKQGGRLANIYREVLS